MSFRCLYDYLFNFGIFSYSYSSTYGTIPRFYNSLRKTNTSEAHIFYHSCIFLSLLIGGALLLLYYVISHKFFLFMPMSDTTSSTRSYVIEMLNISCFAVACYPIYFLNVKLLNAEQYFVIPYILEIIQSTTMFGGLILSIFLKQGVVFAFYGYLIGVLASCIFSFSYLAYKKIPCKISFKISQLKIFLYKSIAIRIGSNINEIIFIIVSNSLLANSPEGRASCFHYALRMVTTIYTVFVIPRSIILQSEISDSAINTNWPSLKEKIDTFYKATTKSIQGVFLIILVSILVLLKFTVRTPFYFDTLLSITVFFVLLSMWYTVQYIGFKYFAIASVYNNEKAVLLGGVCFTFSFIAIIYALAGKSGIYSIPIAATLAQILSIWATKISLNKYITPAIKRNNLRHSEVKQLIR